MSRPSFVFALVASLLTASMPLGAHDFWIEPTGFTADVGRVLGVKLRVGQEFHGDPVPRSDELIGDFVAVDTLGRRQIVGRDGADPAGMLRVLAPGLTIVGYRSRPSPVTLAPDIFSAYLEEEGLDPVIAARARSGTSRREGREIFSRAAKTLVRSGAAASGSSDRSLGFPIELVAGRNPYGMRLGDSLPVQLTFRGAPLSGALIVAFNQRHPFHKLRGRSDRDGRATFTIDEPGPWLVKAVHMVPAPAGSDADWESFWASLTFEMPAA
jgi:uncharacterized GH25 family protein